MSLDFDGVDDMVSLAAITIGSAITFVARFDADNQGEGDSGHIWSHGPVGGRRFRLLWNGTAASKKLRFTAQFSGGLGTWDMTNGFASITGPKFVGVFYDGGSAANDPTFVIMEDGVVSVLTVGAGLTEVAAPSGAITNPDPLTTYVGSTSDNSNSFDGRIGQVALWANAKTVNDLMDILVRGPLGLDAAHLYWPMDRRFDGSVDANDYSGNGRHGTILGALAADNFGYPVGLARRALAA